MVAPFYILTSDAGGFQFLHILANTCYYLFLWLQHFSDYSHPQNNLIGVLFILTFNQWAFILFFYWNIVATQYYILVSNVQCSDLTFTYIMKWSPDKSSNHLSPCKVITILLTVFLMLYITSLWLIYFVTGGLYLLTPLMYFTPSPAPPFWQPPVCSLYLCCFVDFADNCDHMVFVFL